MNAPLGRPRGSGGKRLYEQPRWKFDELIIGLGYESQIVEKLVRRGYPRIPASSIVGWRSRNSIPPIWLPVFIQMGLDEKLINNIEDLKASDQEKRL